MRFFALLTLAAAASATPLAGSHEARGLDSCNRNPVLSVLKDLKATEFCSTFLKFTPQTATVTKTKTTKVRVTGASTVLTTTTSTFTDVIDEVTRTINTIVSFPIDEEVDVTTSTLIVTTVSLPRATSTISSTITVTRTVNAPRAKRELEDRADLAIPREIKTFAANIISIACDCYVDPSTTTVKETVTSTSTILKGSKTVTSTATVTSTIQTTGLTTVTIPSTTTYPGDTVTYTTTNRSTSTITVAPGPTSITRTFTSTVTTTRP